MDAVTLALAKKFARENSPCGETTGTVEVLGETELSQTDDDMFSCALQVDLIIGETYTVNYNGTEYECEVQDCSAMQEGCAGFGDLSSMGGTGNSEPFAAMFMDGTLAVKVLDSSTSVTLSIRQEQTVITPLPVKYLPEGVPWVEETEGLVEVLAECQPIYDENEGIFGVTENVPALEVGADYIVNWNGTDYSCVAQDLEAMTDGDMSGPFFGNPSAFGATDTGEPFAIMINNGMLIMAPTDGSTELTISIYQNGTTVTAHKMDNRCLPDSTPSLFNVNATTDGNGAVTSIDKTFAEIYAAAMDSNKIVRMVATADTGGTMFVSLVSITSASAVFGLAYYASGSGMFMTITVNSDGTASLVYGS